MMVSRHRCQSSITPRCDRGDGLPKRAKCRACGSAWIIERGAYGVFVWTGAGRYRADDAVSWHRNDESAFSRAVELGEEFVSRWIMAELVNV